MKARGFTLIELMIVVAIIAVLAAIAVPTYQTYLLKARVTEGLTLARLAQIAIVESYQNNGVLPNTNAEAGFPGATSKLVQSVVIAANGEINITFTNAQELADVRNKVLQLIPVVPPASTDPIAWLCHGAGANPVPPQYVPPSCR